MFWLRNHARIQEFSSGGGGGGPGQSDKKKKEMVNFKETYHFSRSQRGSNICQGGGSNFFQGGGGSNCLFPIETHITCHFLGGGGGPDPLSPPLDPHLGNKKNNFPLRTLIWGPGGRSQSLIISEEKYM